jgi:hypothetical protein
MLVVVETEGAGARRLVEAEDAADGGAGCSAGAPTAIAVTEGTERDDTAVRAGETVGEGGVTKACVEVAAGSGAAAEVGGSAAGGDGEPVGGRRPAAERSEGVVVGVVVIVVIVVVVAARSGTGRREAAGARTEGAALALALVARPSSCERSDGGSTGAVRGGDAARAVAVLLVVLVVIEGSSRLAGIGAAVAARGLSAEASLDRVLGAHTRVNRCDGTEANAWAESRPESGAAASKPDATSAAAAAEEAAAAAAATADMDESAEEAAGTETGTETGTGMAANAASPERPAKEPAEDEP